MRGGYIFVLWIPAGYEEDLPRGHEPKVEVHIEATAVMQAGLGDVYFQTILSDEVSRYLNRSDAETELPISTKIHHAFNLNDEMNWFNALPDILDFLNIFIIMLTGTALVRERENGTIEHLMIMPMHAVEITLAMT